MDQSFVVLDIFTEYLSTKEKKYHNTIRQHAAWIEQTTILRMLRIQDGRYVRRTMKKLKKMKYYPYKHDPEIKLLKLNDKKKERIIGLLADEKCFWGFYSGYRIYSFARSFLKCKTLR